MQKGICSNLSSPIQASEFHRKTWASYSNPLYKWIAASIVNSKGLAWGWLSCKDYPIYMGVVCRWKVKWAAAVVLLSICSGSQKRLPRKIQMNPPAASRLKWQRQVQHTQVAGG